MKIRVDQGFRNRAVGSGMREMGNGMSRVFVQILRSTTQPACARTMEPKHRHGGQAVDLALFFCLYALSSNGVDFSFFRIFTDNLRGARGF